MPRLADYLLARTERALAAVIVVILIVFAATAPNFLTLSNAVDLIEAYAVTTILAAGLFVVLVSGGIDISFAATASATQYVAAHLTSEYGWGPVESIGLACALGFGLGAINALLTYYLR